MDVGVGVADDLLRVDCPLVVCWVFGGGPRSVGDMLRLRTSRFLAAPARDKSGENQQNVMVKCSDVPYNRYMDDADADA